MKYKYIQYVLCFLLICIDLDLSAQDKNNRNNIIQQRIEFIAEQFESENLDYTTLVDKLGYYYDHPISLNHTTKEELEDLNLLTPFQISNLLSHTRLYGAFTTVYELRTVEAMDLITINNILPFVQIIPKPKYKPLTFKNALRFGKNDLFLRYSTILENQKGYEPEENETSTNKYLGDQNKYYARYRYQYHNKLSFGATGENDAGEEFFQGSNSNGFDFYSAHLFFQSNKLVRKIALGDFQAQFGQGLTMWSGLSYGKSPDAINLIRYASQLKPYTSVNENQFLRGAGITLGSGNWEWTSFYSNKEIDANLVESDSTSNQLAFSSLQNTGLHRTENEIEDKHAVREQIGGTNITYSNENLKLGATGIYSNYEGEFKRTLTYYNQFEFNKNENLNLGLDFTFVKNKYLVFAEVAQSQNDGKAYLAGLQFQPDSRVNLIFYHRNFEKEYQNLFAGAIGELSKNQNEKGTYIGALVKINPSLNFNGYFDIFSFPWLRYQVDTPSDGNEYSAQLNWQVNRRTSIYFRYRTEEKLRNSTIENLKIDHPVLQTKSSFRIHMSHKINQLFTIKNRIEFSSYQLKGAQNQNGFLIYQDILYKMPNSKWSVTGRVASFDVDSYDARIYAYENDVQYAYSVPAYFNKGIRLYLLTNYEITRGLKIWLRYARTSFVKSKDNWNWLRRDRWKHQI